MALTSSEISELAAAGVPAEHIAIFAALDERRDEAKRSKNRECVRKFRSKRKITKRQECNITTSVGNITTSECNITSISPAKSLEVSRNSNRHVTIGKGEGETYKEGGEGRVPLQVSSLSGNKPSEVSAVAEITQVPDLKIAPTKPVPILTSQAQDPKTQVYALAKAKFGERGGGLVGRWAKQFPDYGQLLGFLTAAIAKFPDETKPVIGYVVECIKARRDDAEHRAKVRRAVEGWQPERGRLLPKRDYSDPQNRFFLLIDGKKRYMDTTEVYRKYDDYCFEHNIVEG